MRFKAFLQQREITDDPAGDFVGDARRDRRLPDVTSWSELRAYLNARMASSDVTKAAKRVWDEFETLNANGL